MAIPKEHSLCCTVESITFSLHCITDTLKAARGYNHDQTEKSVTIFLRRNSLGGASCHLVHRIIRFVICRPKLVYSGMIIWLDPSISRQNLAWAFGSSVLSVVFCRPESFGYIYITTISFPPSKFRLGK